MTDIREVHAKAPHKAVSLPAPYQGQTATRCGRVAVDLDITAITDLMDADMIELASVVDRERPEPDRWPDDRTRMYHLVTEPMFWTDAEGAEVGNLDELPVIKSFDLDAGAYAVTAKAVFSIPDENVFYAVNAELHDHDGVGAFDLSVSSGNSDGGSVPVTKSFNLGSLYNKAVAAIVVDEPVTLDATVSPGNIAFNENLQFQFMGQNIDIGGEMVVTYNGVSSDPFEVTMFTDTDDPWWRDEYRMVDFNTFGPALLDALNQVGIECTICFGQGGLDNTLRVDSEARVIVPDLVVAGADYHWTGVICISGFNYQPVLDTTDNYNDRHLVIDGTGLTIDPPYDDTHRIYSFPNGQPGLVYPYLNGPSSRPPGAGSGINSFDVTIIRLTDLVDIS